MADVVIENPVINSAFAEPGRHFRFTDEGITNEIVEGRRESAYFVPIPRAKTRGKQLLLPDTQWTQDRVEPNPTINRIRGRVAQWRQGGYVGVTATTRRLLEYWRREDQERRYFFAQIEALETAIYITEVAGRYGDAWIENELRRANEDANPLLYRIALKMATGSGKTVVMAMLIAWQTLNKLANPQDRRFADAFLIVTPGITIKDRLRVLLPSDPQNYYRALDVAPPDLLPELNKARIVITNFHAFKLREKVSAGKLTKAVLQQGGASAFVESAGEMVRRVCRELGTKRNIVVINDEAHHCYRRRAGGDEVKLTGDERKEAEQREEEARIWVSGLEAVKEKIGVRVVYDLSATPFFLRGSGYSEGTLFPWVVSDFSLIDAIESGVVKVPRVPVSDDAVTALQPTFRDLWPHIRDALPKKGRKTEAVEGQPVLPVELEAALLALYGNYEKHYQRWMGGDGGDGPHPPAPSPAGAGEGEHSATGVPQFTRTETPPVFIVVCNNTNVSKLIYDYIAGWEKPGPDGQPLLVPGQLPLFSNVEDRRWTARPRTILVDSQQLESGEAMSAEFKKIAAREIEEFKEEYRARFPGRDVESLTDEDLLREVMNTVGKPEKLGAGVRCVVSVSMLTEGWDANTVTHILGVRAFGTQLLCEQVVGRGLRRMSYVPNDDEMFEPEYAEVFGVPFSFSPCAGTAWEPKPGPPPTRARALESRIEREITFPRLLGYRYEVPEERLGARFTEASRLALSTQDIPTRVENAPIVGESAILTLDELKARREQEVAFRLAKLVLEKYFHDDEGNVKPWLFPDLLRIAREWLATCVVCKDNTFPQLLLLVQPAHEAADTIYRAVVRSAAGDLALKPVLRPYDAIGSTRYVDFDTAKPVYVTDPAKCHVTHVTMDSLWEGKLAQTLEEMAEVEAYVKNQGLGFTIPYTLNGEEKSYIPDYIIRLRDGGEEPLNLILEVTGEKKKDKAVKVETARTLWVPAVNNHGGFGRWAFLEVTDPWDAQNTMRAFLALTPDPSPVVTGEGSLL
jgi:type III restriction enzyme